MEASDRNYYERRARNERERAASAATDVEQSIHAELAGLCDAQASRPTNDSNVQGISRMPASAVRTTTL